MKYRKQDDDWTRQWLQDSPETVAQAILTRLRLWYGEWFLNVEEGTAWFNSVLGKTNSNSADIEIRRRILDTQGVKEIKEFNIIEDRENRVMTINAVVDTIYGEVTINEPL